MIDGNGGEQTHRELHRALEALHFGFRAITARPDARLAALGYSRVHHRILYFIARSPGCSVNELLGIMRVSKQYLNRPLRRLIEDGRVEVRRDAGDRRIKRLRLTPGGRELEEQLTGEQRRRLARVFEAAGADAAAGWMRVMTLLAEEEFGGRGSRRGAMAGSASGAE